MLHDPSPIATTPGSAAGTPDDPAGTHGTAGTSNATETHGTSNSPPNPPAAPDAQDMLHSVTQGAHQAIDRLAEQVAPQLQRLQQNMAGAGELLDARADQVRDTADAWVSSLRSTVRENPLAAVGAALALGLLVARLTR